MTMFDGKVAFITGAGRGIGRALARGFAQAGALVAAGARIPSGVLTLGVPAKVVRKLRPEELRLLAASAREYRALARRHARTSRVLFGR